MTDVARSESLNDPVAAWQQLSKKLQTARVRA